MWLLFIGVAIFAIVVFFLSPPIRRGGYRSLKAYSVRKSLFKQRRVEEKIRIREQKKRRRGWRKG